MQNPFSRTGFFRLQRTSLLLKGALWSCLFVLFLYSIVGMR